MKIDIDKLRAAHAATTQGEWELMSPGTDKFGDHRAFKYVRVTKDRFVTAEGRSDVEADCNSAFIALAHNEFPTLLDEIERLRNAEKTEHDRRLAVETVLVNLLCVINDDKDGGFFICAEAKDRIDDAQDVMGVAK